ncbi:MAG: release factor glutamine methyltransferase [Hyphomicrobiales bacterium]
MIPAVHGLTVAQARRALAQQFRDANIESPELDARVLIGHALGLDHAGLIAAAAQPMSAAEVERIESAARRRLAGEPVARITGTREFWGLPFIVTPDVLVPRPETETVVETALALTGPDRATSPRILDIATGSGAILLALLSELPHARGVGTDIDGRALGVARRNAAHLGLADRAEFIVSNYGSALGGRFDLVVSNPPYIATAEIATLSREVRDHDPRLALDGGPDGLSAYRAIAADATRLLAPGGYLVLEIGQGQQHDVARLLANAELVPVGGPRRDLAGVARVLAAVSPR